MPDAIRVQSPPTLTASAQSSGLANLLKAGSLMGTVLSQTEDKTVVSFQGRPYPIDVKGLDMKPGQQVLARLVGDQIQLELRPEESQNSAASASRTLGSTLANMGLPQANAQFIAQALLAAGIPLDRAVLNELSQMLRNLTGDQISALSFLFSRGLPVSESLVSFIAHLFAQRRQPAQTADRLLTELQELEEELDKDDDEKSVPPDIRRKLSEFRHLMQSQMPSLRDSSSQKFQEALEEYLRSALKSPEAFIQNAGGEEVKSFGELAVRLLSLLLELQPLFETTKHGDAIHSLIEQAKTLHESLSVQALRNLPSQEDGNAAFFFLQVPLRGDGETKNLELLYKPKGQDKKSASIEFRVEMSKLGPIHADMQWNRPKLTLHLTASQEKARQFLETALDELKEALIRKGFVIDGAFVKTGEIPDTLQPENPTAFPISSKGLDVRA
ncbi:MAG: flagellar hook-length control protein FliK [Candidatus Omnitrophota bacterium]